MLFYLLRLIFLSLGFLPYSLVNSSPLQHINPSVTNVPTPGTRLSHNHLPVLPMSCQRLTVAASVGQAVIIIYIINTAVDRFCDVSVCAVR